VGALSYRSLITLHHESAVAPLANGPRVRTVIEQHTNRRRRRRRATPSGCSHRRRLSQHPRGDAAEALTASELSETCGLPLSTTYRKLDLLTATGLLDEHTRVRQSGKHASEYTRSVDDVVVSLGTPGGTELRMSRTGSRERIDPPVPVVGDRVR